MAFSAGTFTASDLQDTIEYFDELWGNDQVYRHLKKPLPIFNEFATDQASMRFTDDTPFTDPRNCKAVDVIWLTADASTAPVAVDGNDYCDWDGVESGSDKIQYTIPTGKQTAFKVVDTMCKNMFEFQQKIAVLFMTHLFVMDKEMESECITELVSSGDDVSALTPGVAATYTGGPNGGDATVWDISSALSAGDVIPYLEMLIQDQFMSNPVHLTGGKWRFEQMQYAKREGDYQDDRNQLLQSAYPILRSVHDFDGLASGEWFIIDKDAFAYYNLAYNASTTPTEKHDSDSDVYEFKIASPRLSWYNPLSGSVEPVYYDVRTRVKCTGRHEYTAFFMIEHHGDWIRSPKDIESKAQAIEIAFV